MCTRRVGLSIVACLCCAFLAACGDTPPSAPATPSVDEPFPAAEAPELDDDQASFSPSPNWCGTGRVGVVPTMGEWQGPDEEGRYRRLYMRHADGGWVLVTEWGRDREDRFETWGHESLLPLRAQGKVDDRWAYLRTRIWLGQLRARDEETVFRAVLAWGAHGTSERGSRLERLLRERERYHLVIAAAIVLKQQKDLDAVSELLRSLYHKNALARTAVREALEALTGHVIRAPADLPADVPTDQGEEWRSWWTHRAWVDWWRDNGDAVRRKATGEKATGEKATGEKATGEKADGKK